MYQSHYRHAIFFQGQHPYRHSLAEFPFTHPALPGVTQIEATLNWVLAVLYPNTRPAVATPAALPLVGNDINDYRVVQDDGDGKAASYRWEQREGEGAPSWHKIYDMDWGQDSILSAFMDQAQDEFVWRRGRTDVDSGGVPITGIFAGQKISGGNLTGQNLTLDGNSVDATGFVQSTNTFRPTVDGTLDLGTSALKWGTLHLATAANVGVLEITPTTIIAGGGALGFGANNLTTTGNITGAVITGDSFVAGTLTMAAGSIEDSGGTIDFNNTNLTTAGTITAASGSQISDFTFTSGVIATSTAGISFNAANLLTTGTLNSGNATFPQADAGNIRITGNTISATNANGNINVAANGTGIVDVQSAMTTLGITASGVVGITGQLNIDNVRIDGNTILTTNLNGDLALTPNGTGRVISAASVIPSTDNTLDLGLTAQRFATLFLGTAISDGTTSVSSATLQSLRDINVGVLTGMSLFYDGTKWVASIPDNEITHDTLSGLTTGDAGHTQFVMLAGRAGGQAIIGGTAASEILTLESTSNATKGTIQTKDHFTPFATATYSGVWDGTDLGSGTRYFRDLYTRGELKGARLENFTFAGLPGSSAQNVGRLAWATDLKKVYVDTGAGWNVAGIAKYLNDETFDGVQTTKTVTTSASISDARNAIWALHDNANDFEQIFCTIKKTSASQVQITTNAALPAGSYRLVGIE